jgi:hypothetical protein
LPGSGKKTWLNQNYSENTYFSNLAISHDGLDDNDLVKLRDLMYQKDVSTISISNIDFVDIKKLYEMLEIVNTYIENAERTPTYHFILFPQSEQHCIRNVKNQNNSHAAIHQIESLSSNVKKTFMHLKKNFPRYITEVSFSPINAPMEKSEDNSSNLSIDEEDIKEPIKENKKRFWHFRKNS